MGHRFGILLVLVSAVAFGTMAVTARNAYAAGLDVPTLLFLRFGIAAVVLWPMMWATGTKMPKDRSMALLFLMGAGLYFGQSYSYFTAVALIPSALASLLLYLYPVGVALLSFLFLHEKIGRLKAFALGLALLGTALTIGPVGGGSTLGIALAIGAAILYAAYIVVGSMALGKVGALEATTAVITSAALIYGIILLARQVPLPSRPDAWLWATLLALETLVAIGTFLAGMAKVGPVNASTLSAVEPLVTALLGFWLLGETLLPIQIVGGMTILFAVAFIVRAPAPEPHG